MPKYDITVKLTGTDGNAFALMGRVGRAIRAEFGDEAANEFYHETKNLTSYDALLTYLTKQVNVE